MRRRDLLPLLGGVLALYPAVAPTQEKIAVVGYINAAAGADSAELVRAFQQGLGEAGFVEGANVITEYRWAEGHYDRLPALAAEMVHRQVTVIAATSTPVALAAKSATESVPIVFTVGSDPVKIGLVASLSRPGGNITGLTRYNVELGPKRLELLHELVPSAGRIGMLVNPGNPNTESLWDTMQSEARILGVEIHIVKSSNDDELDEAFNSLGALRLGALAIGNDPFFNSRSERLAELTRRHSVPAVYQYRRFVEAGGLISYGASNLDSHRQLGAYVGRILAGAKPADLPVERSTKLDLLINLKTAKALGITVPESILIRADEAIE